MSAKKSTFDFGKVQNFDEHIGASIPGYGDLRKIFQGIAVELVQPGGRMVDLGCSTGQFLETMPKIVGAEYVGVDILNMWDGQVPEGVILLEADLVEYLKNLDGHTTDVITSLFTLQFLDRRNREEAHRQLARLYSEGTTLLIAEKTHLHNSWLNQVLTRAHLQRKRDHFTDSEILDKDNQLFGSMYMDSWATFQRRVEDNYPTHAWMKVWSSYNFHGWCVCHG